jgi:hypothetical protein
VCRPEHLEGRGAALLGQFLDDQQGVQHRRAGSAELLGERDAEQAQIAEPAALLGGQRDPARVPLGGERRVVLAGQLASHPADLPLLLRENGETVRLDGAIRMQPR